MNSDLYRARSPGGVDRVLHGRAGQPMHSVHFPMLSGAPPIHCSHPCQHSGKIKFSPMTNGCVTKTHPLRGQR